MTELIHAHGGQVYMDGANMNAQVGLTSPGMIGGRVSFELAQDVWRPTWWGGPGVGPIGLRRIWCRFCPATTWSRWALRRPLTPSVLRRLQCPYRPNPIRLHQNARPIGPHPKHQSGHFERQLPQGEAEGAYDVLYQAKNGTVAHEMILDCRAFKAVGIEVMDIAKRLIDYDSMPQPCLGLCLAR